MKHSDVNNRQSSADRRTSVSDNTQTDAYLQTITDEYEKLYREYILLRDRCDAMRKQQTMSSESAATILAEAKASAFQIVAEARERASRVNQAAYYELWQINNEKRRVAAELSDMARWLIDTIPLGA